MNGAGPGTKPRLVWQADADDAAQRGAVLVVEAHPQVRQMLGRALRIAGYRVIEAADTDAVTDPMAGVPLVACVIEVATDNGTAGLCLGRALRALHPAAPVIHTTGLELCDLPQTPMPDPMVGYLRKPFGTRTVIQLLTDMVEGDHAAPMMARA